MSGTFVRLWLCSLFRPAELAGVIAGERQWWRPVMFALRASVIPGWLLSVAWLLLVGDPPAAQILPVLSLWLLFGLPFMILNVILPALLLHLSLAIVGAKPAAFRTTLGCICYAQSPMVLLLPAFMTSVAWEIDPYFLVLPLSLWAWLVATVALNRAERIRLPRAIFFTVGAEIVTGFLMSLVSQHVIESYKIPAESMAPTLQVGDHFHLDRLRYRFSPVERGDVIVFEKSRSESPGGLSGGTVSWVKRIVGLPGDTVEMRVDRLRVNGRPLPRCPAGDVEFASTSLNGAPEVIRKDLFLERNGAALYTIFEDPGGPAGAFGPVRVPEGEVFVLGDNRDNSNDSRYFGSIPIERVKGRVAHIWWSNRRPRGFRWERVGRAVMDSEEIVARYGTALAACPGMR